MFFSLWVVLALLHLVLEPRHLLQLRRLQLLWGDVVDGQCYLLVLVVLVEVAVVEVGALLGGNDFLHQFHRRVVLAAVLAALGPHGHFLQCARVGLQAYVEPRLCLRPYGHGLRLVAHGAERELPAVVPLYCVMSAEIRGHGDVMAAVYNAGVRYAVARRVVDYVSCNLRIQGQRHQHQHQKQVC